MRHHVLSTKQPGDDSMKSDNRLAAGQILPAATREAADGGFRWVILLVIWSAFTVSCVDRFAWASIAAPVGHALGFKLALLGSLTTAFYVGYTVSCPLGGIMADKLGSRATLAISMFPLAVLTFRFRYLLSFWKPIARHPFIAFAAAADYGLTLKTCAG